MVAQWKNLKLRKAATAFEVADGTLGFWKAIEEVFPSTRYQRCWVHKTANVLDKVALSVQVNIRQTFERFTARQPARPPRRRSTCSRTK
jgi:transposase-like protein